MQSGIPVSPSLHEAFNATISDPSIFALPATITSESLTPGTPIPYHSPPPSSDINSDSDPDTDARFFASLPLLRQALQPPDPVYLLIRRYGHGRQEQQGPQFIAVTYIPYNAAVRKKTLFASTRATLVRELGGEKFAGSLFVTEVEEVVDERQWRERERERDEGQDSGGGLTGGGGRGTGHNNMLLGERERELEEIKRGEEEERSHMVSGTAGRDTGLHGGGSEASVGSSGFKLPVGEGVEEALRGLQEGPGNLVQLSVDLTTEVITLVSVEQDVQPADIQTRISSEEPRFTFYHYPSPSTVIFIYTCPPNSNIRERMLYASSRRAVAAYGSSQDGFRVDKKIEATMPDEISEERLADEVKPKGEEKVDRGFARPKRPGRR